VQLFYVLQVKRHTLSQMVYVQYLSCGIWKVKVLMKPGLKFCLKTNIIEGHV